MEEKCIPLSWKTVLQQCCVRVYLASRRPRSPSESRAAEGTERFTVVLVRQPGGQHASGSTARQDARAQEQQQPSSAHLFFLSLHRECATSPPQLTLFSPAWLHFVFPNGRCPLPSSQHLQEARGGDGPVRSPPHSSTLLNPRYQSAAGAVTL